MTKAQFAQQHPGMDPDELDYAYQQYLDELDEAYSQLAGE